MTPQILKHALLTASLHRLHLLDLSQICAALLSTLASVVIIFAIELGRPLGFTMPIPFLLLYTSVVFAARMTGLLGGLISGLVVSGYVVYASIIGFGPQTLTGGAIQVTLGSLLYTGTGIFLGMVRDQRDYLMRESLDIHSNLASHKTTSDTSLESIINRLKLQSSVIDASSYGILICNDCEGFPIIFCNAKFCDMTGYRNDEVFGRHVLFNLRNVDSETHHDLVAALANSQSFSGEITIVGKNDNEILSRIKLYPLANLSNDNHFVVIHDDITESRKTELKIAQAQRLDTLGRLSGGVAHDFNNILGIILGNLELAKLKIEPDTEADNYIDSATNAVNRGKELTYRLLAFARKQALSEKIVDPAVLLQELFTLLQRILGEEYELRLIVNDQPWCVEIDESQFENVIVNLVTNARDAMPDGGTIEISLTNICADQAPSFNADQVRISVTDNGHGMPNKVIEQIFDPFFTTKDIGGGTGLGLSMVKGFVKQSGGQIKVRSQIDKGTTIDIYLPKSHEVDDSKPEVKETGMSRGSGERILVVEDEQGLRGILKESLATLNYNVTVTRTATEAVSLLESETEFDLLISDIKLPEGMSGIELAKYQRKQKENLPIVLISGHMLDSDLPLDDNIYFIQKPFRIHDLAEKLQRILAR